MRDGHDPLHARQRQVAEVSIHPLPARFELRGAGVKTHAHFDGGRIPCLVLQAALMGRGGEIYVLEVNASCYLQKDSEFAVAARADGMSYVQLVNEIVDLAVQIVVEAVARLRARWTERRREDRRGGVVAEREAVRARAREPLLNRYFERAAAGELRSVVTLYPTNAAAQDADMSLGDYEDFVYRAGFLDRDDPVAEWQALGQRLQDLAAWLGEKRELRVVADGTDLTLGVEGRTWVPSEGRENFPDGELFTAPLETSVEGQIRFSYPASFAGRRITGIELEFRDGEVVGAHGAQGEEFLHEMLAMDDGARRVGEFSFGLNEAVEEFTGHTLFDEKMGGTVHLALGAAYPESGGKNQSALHWDLVCDLRSGSEVHADGEVVYRDGRFLAVAPRSP